MAKNGIDMRLNLPSDADLKRMFDAVPILQRHKVADQTVRAGARPIVTKARQLAPRGDRTGTSKKTIEVAASKGKLEYSALENHLDGCPQVRSERVGYRWA
jgi:hypothetical protein